MKAKSPEGRVVWLVTRRDTSTGREEIVTVLAPQHGPDMVKRLVELLHSQEAYTLGEQLRYCGRPSRQPYRAKCSMTLKGVPWLVRFDCGHSPFLDARIVENFRVFQDAGGEEYAEWTERYSQVPGLKGRAPFRPFPPGDRDDL